MHAVQSEATYDEYKIIFVYLTDVRNTLRTWALISSQNVTIDI